MRRARALSLALSLGLSLAASLVAGSSLGQDKPPPPPPISARQAVYLWEKSLLRVSFSYRDVVDDEIQAKLKSGIPTVIVMKAWVFEPGSTTPVADLLAPKSCRVVYDLWDELFRVELTQPGGSGTAISPTLAGVLRRCAEVDRMPLVDRARLKVNGTYLVQGIVEVNPISPDIMERIKRWVSRPKGSSTVGAGDALFGSFVGLFVAQIGNADRVLRFKTDTFVVPPPPPPPPPPSPPPPPPKK